MIGIISAMQEEIQALLDNLEDRSNYTKGMRTYHRGRLFNKDVVLAFSRWGKVASAITANQLINDFDISEIIFTGVAGSIKQDLNIGDIVIGKNLIQHDVDASPFFEKFAVPILGKIAFTTHDEKRKSLFKATEHFLINYDLVITSKEATEFNILHPKVIMGSIASGDQFINAAHKVNQLNEELPEVDCVEMEGAAVAQVCYEYDIPFSIFRIISDNAHDNAHIEFQKFANEIATKYALGILKIYFN
jgi:adenosylhomocysteine nucleosidase